MKLFIVGILASTLSSFAHADSCKIKDAIAPFKANLERNYFGGAIVSFRLLLNGPTVDSGKYFFVANEGKWSGPVLLDMNKCTLTTDGNWVMWRTVNETGNY